MYWDLPMLPTRNTVGFIRLLSVFLLSYSFLTVCKALLPAVCTNPSNFYDQICCPEPFVGAGPCGSNLLISRGKCVDITTNQTTTDVRGNWPHYYKKICECESQFGNFDCGECASGFKGVNCNEKIMRTRKLINSMSQSELDYLIKTYFMAKTFPSRYVAIVSESLPGTVPEMKAASVFNIFVTFHYYSSKNQYVYDFGHGGPGFLTWHRQYLMWFEREIQWMLGNDSNFAFPFWDWSSENNRMYPFQEHILGDSDEKGNLIGNFANWTTVCTNIKNLSNPCDPSVTLGHIIRFRTTEVYAANYTRWPRREEIWKAMTIPIYDSKPYNSLADEHESFRNFIEGFYVGNEICNSSLFSCTTKTSRLQLHNQIHNMIDGTMTHVPGSPNDPVFILHHGFIDYIFEMWIRRHHGEFKPSPEDTSAAKGHNYNDLLVPFLPPVRAHEMLVESTTLGWTYESLNGLDLEMKYYHVSDVPNPEMSQSKVQSANPEFSPTFVSDTILQPKFVDMWDRLSSSNSKPSNTFNSQVANKAKQFNICMLNSKRLVFQVPMDCSKLLFPSNLVLPRLLVPLSWYKCSQPNTETDEKANVLHVCTLNHASIIN